MKNLLCCLLITLLCSSMVQAWTEKPVDEDPLVRMPGTQPGQVVDLESDKQCLSCHFPQAFYKVSVTKP